MTRGDRGHRGGSPRGDRKGQRWESGGRNGERHQSRREKGHRKSDRHHSRNGYRDKEDRDSRGYDRRSRRGGEKHHSHRGGRDHGGRRGGSRHGGRDRGRDGGRRHEHRSRSRRWSPHGRHTNGHGSTGRNSARDGHGRKSGHNGHYAGVNGRGRDRDRDRRGEKQRSPATSEYSSSSDSRGSSDDSRKKNKKSGDSDKDEIVHFTWQKGMVMNQRYKMLKLLGDGTFGRVLLAHDQRDNREVAVKVIRDVKRYAENAKIEADILEDIRRVDPRGEATRSAIMFDTFMHERHFCLVFEPCGVSLYDFLKNNSFRGFWMQDIQSFARQSLEALGFLHSKLQMTHTDLKPENILLESMEAPRPADFPRESMWQEARKSSKSRSTGYVRPASNLIRLIDFGNATYEDEHHSSVINTRQYRGPEVILALGWNERSDVWSMGCIFMELYTGELLFGTHENLEHLALMERVLGPLPPAMLNNAPKSTKEKYTATSNDGRCRLQWPGGAQSSSSERHVRSQRPLVELAATKQHEVFAEFVGELLTLDPARRPSATEACRSSFFSERFED